MRLIFLLAIPTFALTALAASTSANTGTGTVKPPIDRETALRRCTEFCLRTERKLNYETGDCYCSDLKVFY
ncbi:hypothetical protein BDB01DRAFT_799434 [Pilobolus umbonatus]|nr:hypothetical protein BDB01DRAFT_799434 [Pilobolus umbonatus]